LSIEKEVNVPGLGIKTIKGGLVSSGKIAEKGNAKRPITYWGSTEKSPLTKGKDGAGSLRVPPAREKEGNGELD